MTEKFEDFLYANNNDGIKSIIEYLNLNKLIKLANYKPYYESQYIPYYKQLANTIDNLLKPFKNLEKPTYPFTCRTNLCDILRDVFELHYTHPTDTYTNKLDEVISYFTQQMNEYDNMQSIQSMDSRKCTYIINLCRTIKAQRSQLCRPYKYNQKAYVLD